jgi:hypothetical protein
MILLGLENVSSSSSGSFNGTQQIGIVLLAGLLGVVAALAGNRYLHVLQLRAEHRKDFLRVVLRPWQTHLQSFVGPLYGILRHGVSVKYAEGSPLLVVVPRAPTGILVATFEAKGVMWERSKQHWPGLHRDWQALQRDAEEFSSDVLRLANDIERRLEPTRGALHWNYDDEKMPMQGLHQFISELLTRLAEHHQEKLSTRLVFRAEEKAQGAGEWALFKDQPGVALGTKQSVQQGKNILDAIRDDDTTRDAINKLGVQWNALKGRATDLADKIEQVGYNYNLGGRCASCPTMISREE